MPLAPEEGSGTPASNPSWVFTAEDLARLERLAHERRKTAEALERVERELHESVRDLYARGATPSQLAQMVGVTRATIHNWLRR
jgi:DNA-directed RNA polymerase specialized sigma24 family protein